MGLQSHASEAGLQCIKLHQNARVGPALVEEQRGLPNAVAGAEVGLADR